MDQAPKDGRFVAALSGQGAVAFAYFEEGKWFAPLDANNEALGRSEVFPVGWLNMSVPSRS